MKNPLRNFCIIEEILNLQKEYSLCIQPQGITPVAIPSKVNSKDYAVSSAHVTEPVYQARRNINTYFKKK